MSDLTECVHEIERQLDEGRYRPGPWARFVRAARRRDQAERRALIEDVSRVSDKVHGRNHPVVLPLRIGLSLEVLAAVAGFVLLELGLRRLSPGWVLAGGFILTVTWQPILKVAVGYLMGIRYSYCYLAGFEPRVKMQYGTYLAAARWRRVVLHVSGTVGSPLAFWFVAVRATRDIPSTAAVCWTLCWILVTVQVVLFIVVLAGGRRGGLLGRARLSSGGSAAYELRST